MDQDETVAGRLRDAANAIREAMEVVTPGPWRYAEGIYPDGTGAIVSEGTHVSGWDVLVMDVKAIGAEQCAPHIASWGSPTMALAAADLLDRVAGLTRVDPATNAVRDAALGLAEEYQRLTREAL